MCLALVKGLNSEWLYLLFMAYVNYNYGSMAVNPPSTREQEVVYVAINP